MDKLVKTPAFATDDPADLVLSDAVLDGERLLADATLSIPPPNSYDLGAGDFRVGVQSTTNVAPLTLQPPFHGSVVHIRGLIAEEQMLRLRAGRVVAFMQDEHSGRDGAVVELPGETGCADTAVVSASSAYHAIPINGGPLPAPTGLGADHLVPVSFGQRAHHPGHYTRIEG